MANKTGEAIVAGTPGERRPVVDEMLFVSGRKWSALAFDLPERPGVYVLGAVEMLVPYLPPDAVTVEAPLSRQTRAWCDQGLCVLLIAHNPEATELHTASGQPQLPSLRPLAVVSLIDELRPQAKETIAAFSQLGLQLKTISGDNPRTVAVLAKQVGLPGDLTLVSGSELAAMSQPKFDLAAADATVFGRIKPEQKAQFVDALLRHGKRVAMMGDGVNDMVGLLDKETISLYHRYIYISRR